MFIWRCSQICWPRRNVHKGHGSSALWLWDPKWPLLSLAPVIPAALHDLHAVVTPSPRTWKANLKACHFVSVICALPSQTKAVPQLDFVCCICVSVAGSPCALVCCGTLFFSSFCALSPALFYPSPGTYQQVYHLDFTTGLWSLCQFSFIVVFWSKKKKEKLFSIMASFKLDFLPEMMVDHCSLNSSPV